MKDNLQGCCSSECTGEVIDLCRDCLMRNCERLRSRIALLEAFVSAWDALEAHQDGEDDGSCGWRWQEDELHKALFAARTLLGEGKPTP